MLWHDFEGDHSLCWERMSAIMLKNNFSDYSLEGRVRSSGRTNTSIC